MKNSTKHLMFVQIALVSLTLAGCSNVKTTKEPTVRDTLSQVINDDNITEDSSLALVGNSNANSPVRSNSVWTSHLVAKEPIAQGIRGHVLEANSASDTTSPHKPPLNRRVAKRSQGRNAGSQKHPTVSVNNALDEVFGSRSTIRQSSVRDALTEVIAASQMSGDDNAAEEQPTQ